MVSMSCKITERIQSEEIQNENEVYPSLEDLAAGFSLVIHAKIIADLESRTNTDSPKNEIFFNRDHLMSFLNANLNDTPSPSKIFSFTFNLYHSMSLNEECLLLTLMYMLRFLKATEIKMFANNWQIIVIGATLTSLRVCETTRCCNLQCENIFFGLSFDDFFEIDGEFSRLMKYKFEVDLSLFERCFEVLACAWEEESKKKRKLNIEKVNEVIRKSKTFAEVEKESDLRIAKSKRIYNIDHYLLELDS